MINLAGWRVSWSHIWVFVSPQPWTFSQAANSRESKDRTHSWLTITKPVGVANIFHCVAEPYFLGGKSFPFQVPTQKNLDTVQA
jgi:hypothetical protein